MGRRIRLPTLGALALCSLLAALAPAEVMAEATDRSRPPESGALNAPHPAEQTLEFVSRVFEIDQVFPSMRGPFDQRQGSVIPRQRELLWLTGYEVEVIDADSDESAPETFECHTNMNFGGAVPLGLHRAARRGFTLTQGQTNLRLPSGFGVPMFSNEPIIIASQALNLVESPMDFRVRHRVSLRFVRDSDLETPMRPLNPASVFAMVSLEGEPLVFNHEDPGPEAEAASCHAGLEPEGVHPGLTRELKDKHGRRFGGHWVVEPGEHEYRTLITDQLRLKHDVTVHFIGVHVHPYSTSLELRDLTARATVWVGRQKTRSDQRGLEWIDYYSSEEGLTLHQGHEYALVSRYENPTEESSDAMASMFLYYHDEKFRKPGARVSSR